MAQNDQWNIIVISMPPLPFPLFFFGNFGGFFVGNYCGKKCTAFKQIYEEQSPLSWRLLSYVSMKISPKLFLLQVLPGWMVPTEDCSSTTTTQLIKCDASTQIRRISLRVSDFATFSFRPRFWSFQLFGPKMFESEMLALNSGAKLYFWPKCTSY